MKIYYIIILSLTYNLLYADSLEAISGDNDSILDNKGQSVKEEIQNDLGDYYLSEGTVMSPEQEDAKETEWVPISPPYDCTPWTLNASGDEERTCSVKKSKISTIKKFSEINNTLLRDFNLDYEEKEDSITQTRAYSAPAPSIPSGPTNEIPEYTDGIVVTVEAPAQTGLGEAFPMKWTSTNAVECTVPQNGVKGGAGTEYATLLTLGTTNLTITCTDGIDSGSKTFPIEVVAVPLELVIETPVDGVSIQYQEKYTLSWRSKGANSCSIDGSSYSQNNVNTSREITGSGVDRTHVVTCTNGVDSITKSVEVKGVLGPPPNGDCTWGVSTDQQLGVTYPFPSRYSTVSYLSLRNGQTARYTEETSSSCGVSCTSYSGGGYDYKKRICGWVGARRWCYDQYCRRLYGKYYHTISCNNGVVSDRYNSSSCDPYSRKTGRTLQNFNSRVYQWYKGRYSYDTRVIWTWPN